MVSPIKHSKLAVVVALAAVIVSSTVGFFYGYGEGWEQVAIESAEEDPLFRSHEISSSSLLLYLHNYRFRIASFLVWLLIFIACLLLQRSRKSAWSRVMLGAAFIVVACNGIVVLAEGREFWDGSFYWDSFTGRIARIAQPTALASSLVFAFGLVLFAAGGRIEERE